MRTLLLIAVLALVGCETVQAPTTTAAAPNAAVTVYAAKGAYEVALTAAVAYAELPRCKPDAKLSVCSSQPVVDQLVRSRNVARDALASAESAVRTPGFGVDVLTTAAASAEAAVKALTTITTTLRTKP